jgi:hypothetical protein
MKNFFLIYVLFISCFVARVSAETRNSFDAEVIALYATEKVGKQACYGLVRNYLDLGENDKALVAARRLHYLAPSDMKANALLGFVLYAKGDYENAVQYLNFSWCSGHVSSVRPLLACLIKLSREADADDLVVKVRPSMVGDVELFRLYILYAINFKKGILKDDVWSNSLDKFGSDKEVAELLSKLENGH